MPTAAGSGICRQRLCRYCDQTCLHRSIRGIFIDVLDVPADVIRRLPPIVTAGNKLHFVVGWGGGIGLTGEINLAGRIQGRAACRGGNGPSRSPRSVTIRNTEVGGAAGRLRRNLFQNCLGQHGACCVSLGSAVAQDCHSEQHPQGGHADCKHNEGDHQLDQGEPTLGALRSVCIEH